MYLVEILGQNQNVGQLIIFLSNYFRLGGESDMVIQSPKLKLWVCHLFYV